MRRGAGQGGAERGRAAQSGAERGMAEQSAPAAGPVPTFSPPTRSPTLPGAPSQPAANVPSNHKWRSGGKSVLRDVVEWLRSLRYTCWLMSPAHLIPLGGRWWAEEYEFFSWSNVVCSRTGESDGALLLGWWNERVLFPFDCEGP